MGLKWLPWSVCIVTCLFKHFRVAFSLVKRHILNLLSYIIHNPVALHPVARATCCTCVRVAFANEMNSFTSTFNPRPTRITPWSQLTQNWRISSQWTGPFSWNVVARLGPNRSSRMSDRVLFQPPSNRYNNKTNVVITISQNCYLHNCAVLLPIYFYNFAWCKLTLRQTCPPWCP